MKLPKNVFQLFTCAGNDHNIVGKS